MFSNRLGLGLGAGAVLLILAVTVLPRILLYAWITKEVRQHQYSTQYYTPPVYEYEMPKQYWGGGNNQRR
jgi:hypothetical protein